MNVTRVTLTEVNNPRDFPQVYVCDVVRCDVAPGQLGHGVERNGLLPRTVRALGARDSPSTLISEPRHKMTPL